jgi:ABC-type multidrug transport system fused ATPase/permease subunit
MALIGYIEGLKAHDASVAIGLLELVRRADAAGRLDRGEWLAAIHSTYVSGVSEHHDGAGLLEGVSAAGAPDDPDRYLDDHVLPRLRDDGIAYGEPEGGSWDHVRLAPAALQELREQREEVEARLEDAVRKLLKGPARGAARQSPAGVAGGSTLSARGLVKAYRKRRVVAEVDIEVSQGEIVGLLGPNGAGKTTTFYMVVGLIGPDRARCTSMTGS